MRVDYIRATHLQCKPRSDRVKAALADGLVTLRDADGGEHVIRDGTFQIVVGAETLVCDGTALPRPFQRLLLPRIRPRSCSGYRPHRSRAVLHYLYMRA